MQAASQGNQKSIEEHINRLLGDEAGDTLDLSDDEDEAVAEDAQEWQAPETIELSSLRSGQT